MKLGDAVQKFCERFKSVRNGPANAYVIVRDVTLCYSVICRGEVIRPGERPLPAPDTEEAAVEQWLREANAFADRQGGQHLVWRTHPQLIHLETGDWEVYSRFVVWDPPAMVEVKNEGEFFQDGGLSGDRYEFCLSLLFDEIRELVRLRYETERRAGPQQARLQKIARQIFERHHPGQDPDHVVWATREPLCKTGPRVLFHQAAPLMPAWAAYWNDAVVAREAVEGLPDAVETR